MASRRDFLKLLAASFFSIISGMGKISESKVYIIKTTDRRNGIKELLNKFEPLSLSGKKVALKANYNSSDPFPASTQIDTLAAIVDELKQRNAGVVLAERSGMGDTESVLLDLGVMEHSRKQGYDVVILDELKSSEWVRYEGNHWIRGFLFPQVFKEADAIVQTCCLKTHRFGGHFTMSLKNSVGMVAKYVREEGYNYMSELHSSRYQRLMIAEINAVYHPEFVIMDGIKGFSSGGPDRGTLIEPGILLASKDRVALDAVGVAVLRIFGTTNEVSMGGIFRQEQIARAAELGIGASGPDRIEVVPINPEAQDICLQIQSKLKEHTL